MEWHAHDWRDGRSLEWIDNEVMITESNNLCFGKLL